MSGSVSIIALAWHRPLLMLTCISPILRLSSSWNHLESWSESGLRPAVPCEYCSWTWYKWHFRTENSKNETEMHELPHSGDLMLLHWLYDVILSQKIQQNEQCRKSYTWQSWSDDYRDLWWINLWSGLSLWGLTWALMSIPIDHHVWLLKLNLFSEYQCARHDCARHDM